MTRTDLDNKNKPKQPWAYLIGAKVEIVEFDDEKHKPIRTIALRVGKGDLLWIGVNVEKPKYNLYLH